MIMIFALLAIFCISAYSISTTRKVGDLVNEIKEHPLMVSNLAADSKRLVTEIIKTYQEAIIEMEPSKKAEYGHKISDYETELDMNTLKIQELILGVEGEVLAQETVNNIAKWRNNNLDLLDKIYDFNYSEGGRFDFSIDLLSEQQDIQIQLSAIQSYAKHKAEWMNNQAMTIEQKAQNNIIVVGTALILFIFGFTLSIIKNILESLNRLKLAMSNSVEQNKFLRVKLTENDEIADVSKHYNTLIGQLEQQFNMRLGISDLSNAISGDLSLEALSMNSISALATFTQSGNGVLYLYNDEEQSLYLTASYAFTQKQKRMQKVALGESLIGQVALDKKAILLTHVTPNEGMINTGLISEVPLNIVGMPLIFEEQLCGVVELASFENFDASKLEYLNYVAEIIAIRIYATVQKEKIHLLLDEAIETNTLLEVQKQEVIKKSEELTQNNEKLSLLFEKSKRQAEDLQAQQEELRQNNEELEEQSRSLRESEEKLRLQQEELKVTNEELETHTRQLEAQKRSLDEKNRALALTQQELMKKADALETNNKYKSEFLANMSHELRTPLNSILVLSQLLKDKAEDMPLSEKEKEFASTIHSAGEDLLILINDVLDLSKVEAGKLTIQKEKVYLKAIVADNRKLFEPMAELRALDLSFSIDSDLPEYIESDALRINQVIRNLVSNAIKFTPEGHIHVRFRNLNAVEINKLMISGSDYIAVEVSDTGIGIPQDKMEVVFEAFKQSDGTTSRQYGGTGLGLTISLEIARLLGGNILHESKENVGSQFSLIVPKRMTEINSTLDLLNTIDRVNYSEVSEPEIDQIEIDEIENKTEAIENKNEGIEKENEKRLLIIEDDPVFAQIISDLAEEKGYTVTKVYTGKKGFEIAKSWQPVGIVLDIGLPDMDGIFLAKRLAEEKITQHIPIHIISGMEAFSSEKSMDEMPKSIIGFLKKPVDIKMIYKTLSKLESVDMKGVDQILVVGSCGDEDFEKFTKLGQFRIQKVLTGKEAFVELESKKIACIILDIMLSDISGVEFMRTLRESLKVQTPIIIYTDEAIDLDEIDDINQYAETIILKSQRSRERLVDEVTLFLFDINQNHSIGMSAQDFIGEDKKALSGIRILLADDDNRNIFALRHLLEQSGVQVIVAKDGMDAVEKFEKNEVDLILMDIMMPKMDGFEAMSIIRKSSKGHSVPIIALTAKAMIEDRDKCINAGANDYLVKPVDTQKLMSMIKVWLS